MKACRLLETAYETGLSGPSRLHDLFVTHEGMSPGDYKTRGAGLTIRYGFLISPFGLALVMVTDRGLAGLAFADPGKEREALADMTSRWPNANYVEDLAATAPYAARIFNPAEWRADRPLKVVTIGTDFQLRVWEALLKIPMGKCVRLFGYRRRYRVSQGFARRRCRCWRQPGQFRRPLPPGSRQVRSSDGLSLGPDPQTRHPRMGSRPAER